MAKQNWTQAVLALLPATVREINSNPVIRQMNEKHLQQRKQRGAFITWPVNSMAYDTLYRLRAQGKVKRDDNGVYRLVK
jgi:hypothetical protein